VIFSKAAVVLFHQLIERRRGAWLRQLQVLVLQILIVFIPMPLCARALRLHDCETCCWKLWIIPKHIEVKTFLPI